MSDSDIDSLIIGKTSNVRYLTGFRGDFGYVIIRSSKALFLTSPLYSEDARSFVSDQYDFVEFKEGLFKCLADFNSSFWGKRTGYEAEEITCASYTKLSDNISGTELVPVTGFVEELREKKEMHEIESMRQAQAISEMVFTNVLVLVREGVEERDLAIEIDYQFRKLGGERSAFETIVASGPHTSRPHAIPSRRKFVSGDLILFDMGTVIDGYASDMTRTVALGKASDRQKKLYSIVLEAQMAALDGIRPGLKCSDVDRIARDVIDKAGYGEHFIHGLGHGIGLEVHEKPVLSRQSEHILQKNSVFTVEPGVYLHGWGGIRIEDMVVAVDNRCDNLTGASKELLEL